MKTGVLIICDGLPGCGGVFILPDTYPDIARDSDMILGNA